MSALEPAIRARRAIRPVLRSVRSIGLRAEDRLLVSFPRSGSTWLRFILVDLLTGTDPEWASVNEAIPYVGRQRTARRLLPGGGRMLQTHDLDAGACRRAIYLARDVRDVLVAKYRWHVRGGYTGDLGSYMEQFLSGRSELFGTWSQHVTHWVAGPMAQRGDLLVLRYEDLRRDPAPVVRRTLEFLGVAAGANAVASAIEHNALDRMREKEERNPSASRAVTPERFVGTGTVGGWQSRLTAPQVQEVEVATRSALELLGYPLSSAPDA